MSLAPPSDITTGVSNGDVDWLFRSKSKKLEKKLNLERRPSVSLAPDRPDLAGPAPTSSGRDTRPGGDKENSPSAEAASDARASHGPENKPAEPAASAARNDARPPRNDARPARNGPQTAPDSPPSPRNTHTGLPGPSPVGLPPATRRSRSSSAPQPPKQPAAVAGALPAASRRTSVAVAQPPATVAPIQPPAPVSRANSGKGRSFFSSLSAKFKHSAFSAPPSAPAAPPAPSALRASSPTATAVLPAMHVPKSAPSGGPSPRDQDLAASVNKPPLELAQGVPPNRLVHRASLTSLAALSPRPSSEKERGFFRRRSLMADAPPAVAPTDAWKTAGPAHLAQKPRKPELCLRRVSFALDKLDKDPQQQIPSRRPRKGAVLVPEDLKAPPPRLALGISTADGSRSSAAAEPSYTDEEFQRALEAQHKALLEAAKHAVEAHLSAKKLACQIAGYKASSKSALAAYAEEDDISQGAENIAIDNPLHVHLNHFENVTPLVSDDEDDDLTPETIYTRCCHLREILPIPATLKQLKHKPRPLQILKMLNPRPTLIDVLSFSDFITIMPINTVIFDNVTMTTEMLKHVLAGLVHSKHLEKLSLRNVAIDKAGWGYLCEFMSRNHNVKKLDISQQRVKHLTKPSSVRSAMNWNLFIDALKSRNGIEELVMGGCKLSDDVFENLLEHALTVSTCRLGVAATEINVRKCELLADWIGRPNSKCVGIDIASNDLSQGQLKPFIDAFNTKTVNLVFFSLNATSLSDIDEVGDLLKGLSRLENLRFFDFSSLPQLFPHVISKLGRYLPNFKSLRRMHFDLNELSSQSIAALADVFPKVPNLVHVSLLGNTNLDRGSIGALYTAVKLSSIFTLDLDYDLIPDELSQRLALYLMRNFDKAVKPNISDYAGNNEQDDVMFDGSLLMETAEKMLTESDQNPGEVDLKLQKIITNALIERTNSVRKDMHRVIDSLFEQRNNGNLSFEGKENLLRFCLLDASLEKLVHMFEQKAKMFSSTPLSPSTSIQDTENSLKVDREKLHAGSSALIAAGPILMARTSRPNGSSGFQGNESTLQPHLVVIDANSDGRDVIIDNLTGRPILMKSVSQSSLYAKEQEEEEGEFLRWGYFMEHLDNKEKVSDMLNGDECRQELSVFGTVPSGSELREAIIDAKGVESVTDLISKINTQRVSLENIYRNKEIDEVTGSDGEVGSPLTMSSKSEAFQDATEHLSGEDNVSIDSGEGLGVHPVVDEAYDKLLNEAQRVMSNK
ncbi:RNI-like protein [Metschnikowia bicuspidata var. bicuspidata NRRL YB-4993]|uniref:RNI-like protein n=1 Tax=Metschnikowia bicuspidata var. bicuspidata NRRL YB-4993 TaxID=869754 RepID=A0A1A0HAD0_9ASCO|nr:RNI-like protein [Metschnikowia bicuspidata var. bicuspidata NRRL YB-4993]OBA20960.1 RNI-like protein [Metschnikowia bicuspidata var. bicuspidata NRRL YB-4993]